MTERVATTAIAYRTPYPEGSRLPSGTRLKTTDRKSEYPGWTWCLIGSNAGVWISEKYIDREADDRAVLNIDYDSTELSVDIGDRVRILRCEQGWAWCQKNDGVEGWLPLNIFESDEG